MLFGQGHVLSVKRKIEEEKKDREDGNSWSWCWYGPQGQSEGFSESVRVFHLEHPVNNSSHFTCLPYMPVRVLGFLFILSKYLIKFFLHHHYFSLTYLIGL